MGDCEKGSWLDRWMEGGREVTVDVESDMMRIVMLRDTIVPAQEATKGVPER